MQKLIKGEQDWHNKINNSFAEVEQDKTSILNTIGSDKLTTKAQNINGAVNEVVSQLSEKANDEYQRLNKNYNNENQTIITFVTDDSQITDYDIWYKQIFEPEGVPATSALLTKFVGESNPAYYSWEQAHEMRNSGWSIVSHGDAHIDASSANKIELQNDYMTAYNVLKSHNLDYELFITPYGHTSDTQRSVCRNIYQCAIDTPDAFIFDDLTKTMSNYKFGRRHLMEYASLAQCKAEVDMAINEGMWLIFMGHSWLDYYKTGNGISELRELIQYIKSKNIPIVNLVDGFKIKGNILDVGEKENDKDYTIISSNGKFNSNLINPTELPGVGGVTTSKYIKLATAELFYAGGNAYINIDIFERQQGTIDESLNISCKISQRTAMGTAPEIYLSTKGDLLASQVKAIITKNDTNSSVVELWFSCVSAYRQYVYKPYIKYNSSYDTKLTYHRYKKGGTWQDTLPTGIVKNSNDKTWLKKIGDTITGLLSFNRTGENTRVTRTGTSTLGDNAYHSFYSPDGITRQLYYGMEASDSASFTITNQVAGAPISLRTNVGVINIGGTVPSVNCEGNGTCDIGSTTKKFKNAYFTGFVAIYRGTTPPANAIAGSMMIHSIARKILWFDGTDWWDSMGNAFTF